MNWVGRCCGTMLVAATMAPVTLLTMAIVTAGIRRIFRYQYLVDL